MLARFSKILLVASAGALLLLVGLDNIFDYDTNYEVVRHILSMDALPKDSPLLWRALPQPALHRAFYAFIIAAELIAAVMTLAGALRLWRARADGAGFDAAKGLAILGLSCAFALYFFGFLAVGGEWFQMWRSETFNMQQAAFRFIGSIGLVLLFLNQRDADR